MAKTDTAPANTETIDDENVEFDTFVPEPVYGRFDKHVERMVEKDKQLEAAEPEEFKNGKRTRVKILSTREEADKTVRQFQDSARKYGKTGRHVGTDPQGDGGVLLHFVLGVRQSRPRKPKDETGTTPETGTAVVQAEDVPQETGADQGAAA